MSASEGKKIRVLIVDDSAIIRSLLTKFLSADPGIEVVSAVPDPYVAREKLVELKPDVITLDIEMPRMDGVTFLKKIMTHLPTRTLVISSLTPKGSETALQALEAGAVDVMAKPTIDVTQSMEEMGREIVERVKMTARARLKNEIVHSLKWAGLPKTPEKLDTAALAKTTHQVVAIASSTGGTEALKVLLPALPTNSPGILVVQHMPPVFTKTYASALARICPFEVREAVEGDRVLPGLCLVCPGDYHMELVRSGAFYSVKLHQKPPLHGVRPAADYLMKSVARYAGANAIGVVLTGMGKDGAEGLLEMKKAGSFNIAQDEASSIVWGMPKVAFEMGAIDKVMHLDDIAQELIKQFKEREVVNKKMG